MSEQNPRNSELTLAQIGRRLIWLDRQGFRPARGYTVVEQDSQFGEGSYYIAAGAVPPTLEQKLEDGRTARCLVRNLMLMLATLLLVTLGGIFTTVHFP